MSEFSPFRPQKGVRFGLSLQCLNSAGLLFSLSLWMRVGQRYGASGHLVLLRFSDRLYLTTMMRRISFYEFLYCCGSFSIHAWRASRPWVLLVFYVWVYFKKKYYRVSRFTLSSKLLLWLQGRHTLIRSCCVNALSIRSIAHGHVDFMHRLDWFLS